MKKIFNILTVSLVCAIGMGTFVSCEEEALKFGDNITGGEGVGNKLELDLIAYNVNTDSLRSDQSVLQNAVLGVYADNVFGKTESKLYSQIRMATMDPKFGENPQVDSVTLTIPVYYKNTKESIKSETIYIYKAPDDKPDSKDTLMIRRTITVDSIYGNKDRTMKLNVREINNVLYTDKAYYSNPLKSNNDVIETNSAIIGTGTLGNTVENITLKVKDKGQEEEAATEVYTEPVGYKIKLSKQFFQDRIIANEKTGLLSDDATFIRRVIKGLEFSVEDENGFLVKFNPGEISAIMHYKADNPEPKKENEINYKARISANFKFVFSTLWTAVPGSNVQISHIANSNPGQAYLNSYTHADPVNGASRLYLRGMSGDHVNIKFIKEQIDQLKRDAKAKNWAIVGAKIQLYIDEADAFPKAPYILGWNKYQVEGKPVDKMFADVSEFPNSYPYSVHFNPFNKDKDFYTLDLTKHIKNMVEKGNVYTDQEMIITMGNFLMNPQDQSSILSLNPYRNDRVSNPYRVVLHGNKTENQDKKLKLIVYYTSK